MRGLLCLIAALWTGSALAQTPELQPSPAQQCLQHRDGEDQRPDYPFAEFNALRPGRVQVALTFSGPDQPPQVAVLLQEGGERFADAVLAHARGLRVPCLPLGAQPVQLRQDFIFSPGQPRAVRGAPEDAQQQARRDMLNCLVHRNGWTRPAYPAWARRNGLQGRVVVRARFANATGAPEVEVFSRPYAAQLAEEVKNWTLDTRLPCHTGEPVTVVRTHTYVFEGDRYGFKTLTFKQFLGLVKGIREQTLKLDTHTMGCPFDVQLSYRQPQLRNGVHVLGGPAPERRPLLDWLANSELDLDRDSLDAIWGDDLRLTIPCLKIDLNPKEKTS